MSGGADDQSPMGGGPQPTPPTMPTPPMTGMPTPRPTSMPMQPNPMMPGNWFGGPDEDMGGGMPMPTPWGGGARIPGPMPSPGWLSNGPAGLNPGGNPLDTLRGMLGGGGGARPPMPTPRPFGGGADEDRIPGAMGSLGRLAAQPPRRPSSGSPPPTPRSRGPNRGRGNPGGY